jgi:hypothetical protein
MDHTVAGLTFSLIALLRNDSAAGYASGGGGLSPAIITNIRDVAINVVVSLWQAALEYMSVRLVAG